MNCTQEQKDNILYNGNVPVNILSTIGAERNAERCSHYTGWKGSHPEKPGQAGEVGPREPNEVQ